MKLLSIFALVASALAPLPQQEEVLIAALCNGGVVEIPLSDKDPQDNRDCHQQGCHAGNCRERFDRDQRKSRR